MASDNATTNIRTFISSAPDKRTKFIYEAIIISLFVHVLILGVIYLSNSSPVGAENEIDEPTSQVEELELKFEEPDVEIDQASGTMSESVRNLIANASSGRTNERVNYSNKSQAEIDAEVMARLKGLEAAEYDQLRQQRGETDYTVPDPQNKPKQDADKSKNQNGETVSNPSNQSYSGPVSAEFDLAGRNAKKSPKPTYRCKSSGKVIVNIEVNALGEVINASIDPKSSADECIREESLSYAKRWVFDYNEKAAKKQPGKITFTFSSQ
ncbi:MAG: energy transducer TonB [Flavobacteriales bacterium]